MYAGTGSSKLRPLRVTSCLQGANLEFSALASNNDADSFTINCFWG
jgi:hypothetical protein